MDNQTIMLHALIDLNYNAFKVKIPLLSHSSATLGLVLISIYNVASLSGPTVFLQCYSLLLLYFGQINDYDDPEPAMSCRHSSVKQVVGQCHTSLTYCHYLPGI